VRLFWLLVATTCGVLLCVVPSARAERSAAVSLTELSSLLEGLGDDDLTSRQKAADSVLAIGPSGTHAISDMLGRMRATGVDPGVRIVLHAAEVERATARGEDWTATLLAFPPTGVSHRTALTTTCLLGALSRIGTTEAVHELVLVARDQGGAYKPEVALLLQKLGDRATAGLVLASHDSQRDLARWASGELEALGKRVPGDAVQTRSNQVLSDVLDAYGFTRDLDALGAVLSFVNSDRREVREAARRATLAYGDAALAKLREAHANLTGTPPPPTWSAAEVARELFVLDDRSRLQDVYGLMDEGLADEAQGKHEEAVDAFQKVLARQPQFERQAEMVPAFVLLARSKEETDRPAAEAYYRAAARLAPEGPRASQIASALDFLEGEDLLARGIPDARLFRRAADEDPGNAKAHAELARLELDEGRHARTVRRYTEAAGALAAMVAGLVLLAGRRPRSKRQARAR